MNTEKPKFKSQLDKRLDAWRKSAKRRMRKKWTYKILKGGELKRPSNTERIEAELVRKRNSNKKKKQSFKKNKDPWAGTKVSCSLWTVKKR